MINLPVPARVAMCVLVAVVVGGGMGLLYHGANPDKPLLLSLLVFIPAVGLVPAVSLYWLLWPTPRMRAQQREAEHSVERRWLTESMSTAFLWLASGLILCDVIGDLLNIAWLSPLSLVHVVVVGGLAWGISYLAVRLREA